MLKALGLRAAAAPFAHGAVHHAGAVRLYDSYHCSRYNTNTRVLTPAMFEMSSRRCAPICNATLNSSRSHLREADSGHLAVAPDPFALPRRRIRHQRDAETLWQGQAGGNHQTRALAGDVHDLALRSALDGVEHKPRPLMPAPHAPNGTFLFDAHGQSKSPQT